MSLTEPIVYVIDDDQAMVESLIWISEPELQTRLNSSEETPALPIIFISGHGDVPLAVRVMKAGAVDFLTKPFNDQILLESINKALRLDKANREKRQECAQIRAKFALLSMREVQVLQGIVAGKPNKVISAELKISLKTVEAHRASVMRKMSVRSVPELVKIVLTNSMQETAEEE